MIPTKVKTLVPEVANALNIPEEHLGNMVSFFYKENKKLLVNLEHLHVSLEGLGKMTIKGWLIREYIEKCERIIETTKNQETADGVTELKKIYERIEKKWIEQETRKKEFRKVKKQYYDKVKQDNNETQGKNSESLGE